MARLKWNAAGERTFEAGVDRGVLYVENLSGVVWNGLISVSENPTGGEVTPYYIDGVKYLNEVSREEFEATIEAFTYPEVFALCDGTAMIGNGLYTTQQMKKPFGLSYRTIVGNDLDSLDHGYKIHIVYNATATPTPRPNNTITQEIELSNFSWAIFTKPVEMQGFSPSAHFVIDSRDTPLALLEEIEDILYGTDDTPPQLPTVIDLLSIFGGPILTPSDTFHDAGSLFHTYDSTIDAGYIPEPQLETADGGGP